MSTGRIFASGNGLRLGGFGIRSGVGNETGPVVPAPLSRVRNGGYLLIALLLLVEPVLRAGEVFRPFPQVEISRHASVSAGSHSSSGVSQGRSPPPSQGRPSSVGSFSVSFVPAWVALRARSISKCRARLLGFSPVAALAVRSCPSAALKYRPETGVKEMRWGGSRDQGENWRGQRIAASERKCEQNARSPDASTAPLPPGAGG